MKYNKEYSICNMCYKYINETFGKTMGAPAGGATRRYLNIQSCIIIKGTSFVYYIEKIELLISQYF